MNPFKSKIILISKAIFAHEKAVVIESVGIFGYVPLASREISRYTKAR